MRSSWNLWNTFSPKWILFCMFTFSDNRWRCSRVKIFFKTKSILRLKGENTFTKFLNQISKWNFSDYFCRYYCPCPWDPWGWVRSRQQWEVYESFAILFHQCEPCFARGSCCGSHCQCHCFYLCIQIQTYSNASR